MILFVVFTLNAAICVFIQAGCFASNSFTKHIPDALQSSFHQTVDEKNVLVIDKATCTMSNLSSLIDAKNNHPPGNNSFIEFN